MSDCLRPFQRVVATVRSRALGQGGTQSPGMLQLEGKQFELMVAWRMDAADRFPGEFGLTPTKPSGHAFMVAEIFWIASGDVQIDRVLA
jgi:hypothetical protein